MPATGESRAPASAIGVKVFYSQPLGQVLWVFPNQMLGRGGTSVREASAGICTSHWNSMCRLQPMCLVLAAVRVRAGGSGEECGFPNLVCMGVHVCSIASLKLD